VQTLRKGAIDEKKNIQDVVTDRINRQEDAPETLIRSVLQVDTTIA